MSTGLTSDQLAQRVAAEIAVGSYVNLGIGLPTLVANHLKPSQSITLHTENGMLGMGPEPAEEDIDYDLLNAGKFPVTELPGASYFDHAESFAMIRGRHLDVCVMGAFQVSARGDLANWRTTDRDAIPGVGGAMDLAIGARSVYVMMRLFTSAGEPKILPECTFPLTGERCISRVYTDHGTFELDQDGVRVRDLVGIDRDDLSARLGLPLIHQEQP